MAGSKSNYLENAMLNGILGGPTFTPPSTVYLALSSAAYNEAATGASMSELTGGGYARVPITNNATNWPAASAGQKSNGTAFTFGVATGDWLTIQSAYICDAAVNGNVLYGADLAVPRLVASGDSCSFGIGAIVLTED